MVMFRACSFLILTSFLPVRSHGSHLTDACDEETEISLRQLRAARQVTNVSNATGERSMACAGLEAAANIECAESVLWAFEKGLKENPGWYFVPLGKISAVGPNNAKLGDLQRIFYCGRAGATRCGLPPCSCSSPPCDVCEAPEMAPRLSKAFKLIKRFDFTGDAKREFDVVQIPDQNMTHSCSNYVDDGSTVFTKDGKMILKVSSACPDGTCLNSGRVMSRDAFTYGIFTFSAKVPKCNSVWPALWLLPESSKGNGKYGPWPCSGEIDLLETVNDDPHGAFNLVAGFGSRGGCYDPAAVTCNACAPPSYCTSTTLADAEASHLMVEDVNCAAGERSWKEHLFVLLWQRDEISAFVDPILSYNGAGELIGIEEKKQHGSATFKTYKRPTTPTWSAVQDYMSKCFPGRHTADAPFDIPMKIVMNIAVGGYGGAPCSAGWEGEFRRGSAMRDRTRSRRRDHLGKARARRRDSRNSRARSKRSKRRQRSSRRRRSLTVKRGEGRKRVGARRSLESLFHWRKALESSWDLDSTTTSNACVAANTTQGPERTLPVGTRWQVYCDLDGVLADFDQGVVERTGNQPKEFSRRTKMWRRLAPPRTKEFFAKLDWMQGGAELWKYLEPLCPAILTGSPSGDWAGPQKVRWCEKNLRLSPDRVLVVNASDKALFSHPGAILVDDRAEYRDDWEARGGIFVHFKEATDSIAMVKEALQKLCYCGALPPGPAVLPDL